MFSFRLVVSVAFFVDITIRLVNGQCPAGWTLDAGTNTCLNVFVNLSPGYDFTDSQTFCASQAPGAQLASVTTQSVYNTLIAMSASAVEVEAWCESQLQVGASWTSSTDHTWIWTDCQPWNAFSDSLWDTGKPDDFGGNENTAQITLFSFAFITVGKMNDCTGSNLYHNIACEIQLSPTCPGTTTAATTTMAVTTTTTTIATTTTTTTAAVTTTTTAAPGVTTTTAAVTTTTTAAPGVTTTAGTAGATMTTTAAASTSTSAGATTTTTAVKTTTTKAPTCCPTGGIWSQWTVGNCMNGTYGACGACGHQVYTRTCLSAGNNCKCKGNATETVPCANELCPYPYPVCCSGYHKILIKQKWVCGPIPKVAKSVTATCPGSG